MNTRMEVKVGDRVIGYIYIEPTKKECEHKSWHDELGFGHDGMDTLQEAFDDLMEMDARRKVPFWS